MNTALSEFSKRPKRLASCSRFAEFYMVKLQGGARGVMGIVAGNGQVQILDEADCISHSTNTLGKGMNPIILPSAIGK